MNASDDLQSCPNPRCSAQTCGRPGVCSVCGHSTLDETGDECVIALGDITSSTRLPAGPVLVMGDMHGGPCHREDPGHYEARH